MCAITGYYSNNLNLNTLENINKALNVLNLRGPDSTGRWQSKDKSVGFGHARLSIQDLSKAGHQPMHSSSGRYTIIFNGEIYNHLELRAFLEYEFQGHSDTETICACIEAHGINETLRKIKGMFALAVYDNRLNFLYLSRDRFGEKPLYYTVEKNSNNNSNFLYFASEIKALFEYEGINKSISPAGVSAYFELGYIPGNLSIYEGIFKLEAGDVLVYDLNAKSYEINKFYDTLEEYASLSNKKETTSYNRAIATLDECLNNVIQSQMLSDVPLGGFLSGGIDSSLIVSIMQANSSKKIQTFTIGYNETAYSEAHHAKAVAKHIGTEHHEFVVTQTDVMEAIKLMPEIYGEPFSDPSMIPTYLLSKMTRNEVTVALSGDAGDEIFAGYNRYELLNRYWGLINKLPRNFRGNLAKAMSRCSDSKVESLLSFLPVTSVSHKFQKLAKVLASNDVTDLYKNIVTNFETDEVLLNSFKAPYLHELITTVNQYGFNDLDKYMALDIKSYLCEDILTKVDRAAMHNSLETRAPFLHPDLVEFAWSLPIEYKISNKGTKLILRDLLYKYVPKTLIDRPKMGFGFPIDVWLRGELKGWAERLLSKELINHYGILNFGVVEKYWLEHQSGKANRALKLWSILMFQQWLIKEFD